MMATHVCPNCGEMETYADGVSNSHRVFDPLKREIVFSCARKAPEAESKIEGDPLDGRQPFVVECQGCTLVWVPAYAPMAAGTFAKVIGGARCPGCGASASEQTCSSKEPQHGRVS